jgi:hypothetical protein
VAKPLRVDYGDTRRKLGSSDTEHADVERASGELGRWASTTPARNEEGVTEHLVGGLLHRVTNAQQCGPERGQVLLAHGAQVGVDPCHHVAPRRALAAHGLVRAFLPRLLNVQHTAQSPAEERPPPGEDELGDAARKRSRMDSTDRCPNEKALPAGEKTTAATSAPHRVDSSLAFLNSPARLLEKHTCRASSLSMRRISIF